MLSHKLTEHMYEHKVWARIGRNVEGGMIAESAPRLTGTDCMATINAQPEKAYYTFTLERGEMGSAAN